MVASGPTELERVAEEQAALRRVATLVAEGATEAQLAAAVTAEIGRYAAAQRAATMRCEGDTFRAVGVWSANDDGRVKVGQVFPMRGDTVVARVAETSAPVRLDGIGDLETEFARARW